MIENNVVGAQQYFQRAALGPVVGAVAGECAQLGFNAVGGERQPGNKRALADKLGMTLT